MAPFPCEGGTIVALRDLAAIESGYLGVAAGEALKVLHIGCGENAGWFYASRKAAPEESGWLPVRDFVGPPMPATASRVAPAQVPPVAAKEVPAVAEVPASVAEVPASVAEVPASVAAEPTPSPDQAAATLPSEPRVTRAQYAVEAYPAISGRAQGGYLAPIATGEELNVLWEGDQADEGYSRWAYARRRAPPHDEGWVRKDVVCEGAPLIREQEVPDAAAPGFAAGGIAYHLRAGGRVSQLQASPGEASAGEGSTTLEHNEMVRVLEVSGPWARVATQRGASGWVRAAHLRHAPAPAGPPPSSNGGSGVTTPRRRVTFGEEPVSP